MNGITESSSADLLNREMSADKFLQTKLWMRGPEWILDE